MPIVFAFCRTAPSVRFIALATFATGVLAFECALSSRMFSLDHGLRVWVFFFGVAPLLYVSSMSVLIGTVTIRPSLPIGCDEEHQLSGFVRRLGGRPGGDGADIPCCWGRWHNAGVRSRVPL
jgi:hypothetical protein